MSKNIKKKKNKKKQENGELEELSKREYKELYRHLNARLYTLVHKGYVVHTYDLDNFIQIYDEEREKRARLTKEQRRKSKPILDIIAENSKVYTWKMAEIAAKKAGMSTKKWMKETISELYTDTFLKPSEIDIKKAAKVKQVVFDYFLQQTDDYDIAHAEYMTKVKQ